MCIDSRSEMQLGAAFFVRCTKVRLCSDIFSLIRLNVLRKVVSGYLWLIKRY